MSGADDDFIDIDIQRLLVGGASPLENRISNRPRNRISNEKCRRAIYTTFYPRFDIFLDMAQVMFVIEIAIE